MDEGGRENMEKRHARNGIIPNRRLLRFVRNDRMKEEIDKFTVFGMTG
jgi:hypothetical protein